jgi:hypothetical protein
MNEFPTKQRSKINSSLQSEAKSDEFESLSASEMTRHMREIPAENQENDCR